MVCIIVSMLLDGSVLDYINIPSIFIVIGGTFGALIASYPLENIKNLLTLFKLALKKSDMDFTEQIDEVVQLSELARKNGILALEEKANQMDNQFAKDGIMLILSGSDADTILNVLKTDIYFMDERHSKNRGMFDTGAKLSPAFGMIGTLIGLINMLKKLDDPSTLGPAMAVALITTFYGVVLANLFFSPVANQLRLKSHVEQTQKEIILKGILSIQDGENPREIREKLLAFVSEEEIRTGDKKDKKKRTGPEK